MVGLQQPVNSDQEAYVLSGQPNCSQDQNHGHQSGTGNTGSSHTSQSGRHTARKAKVNLTQSCMNSNIPARLQAVILTYKSHIFPHKSVFTTVVMQ